MSDLIFHAPCEVKIKVFVINNLIYYLLLIQTSKHEKALGRNHVKIAPWDILVVIKIKQLF